MGKARAVKADKILLSWFYLGKAIRVEAFQTKKSNLERDLRKETDIKWVTKGNRKFPHTLF